MRTGVICFFLLSLSSAGLVCGADITWTNPAGGLFGDADNWDAGVPGNDDKAIIKLDGELSIKFDANTQTDMLQIGDLSAKSGVRSKVVFDLSNEASGYVYTLTGLEKPSEVVAIGGTPNVSDPQDVTTLTVIGGTLKTENPDDTNREICVPWNFALGAAGTLVVSGEQARVETDLLKLARYRETGCLEVLDGGVVQIKELVPCLHGDNQSVSRVLVKGTGSAINFNRLARHEYGRCTIIVEDGGKMISGGEWLLATRPNSYADILVTGSGSQIKTGHFTALSWLTSINRNTTVIAEKGGNIATTGDVRNQFENGTVQYLVADEGSRWDVSGYFYLGGRLATVPHGDDVILTIGENADVKATGVYVHHAGRLFGEGTVTVTSSSRGLTVRGGLVEPGLPVHSYNVPDVCTYNLESTIGTLTVAGNYYQEVYEQDGINHVGTLRIKVAGDAADKLKVEGNITLVANDTVKPRLEVVPAGELVPFKRYKILEWDGSLSGEFEVVLPQNLYWIWHLDELYSDGIIYAKPVGTSIKITSTR